MRKIREALDLVGLRSNELLLHHNKRVIYGVKLAKNFREVLLGMDRTASYIIPQDDPGAKSELIAEYWRQRWLSPRIARPGVLEAVAQHNLSYPIVHGAIVPLPADIDEAPSLFW